MALPLGQKKSLRLQYAKCPKIKLNKIRSVKFACQRFWHWIWHLRAALCRKLLRWSKPLVCVDRHRGGEMFAGLQLHKLTAFITLLVSLTIFAFLLLPYLLFACNFIMESCLDLNTISEETVTNPDNSTTYFLDWIETQPFIYYSFFSSHRSEGPFNQHFPLIYLSVSLTCQICLTLYIGRQLVILIKGVTWEETADSWFKSIFSSWNHNMVCQTSATLKHRSIYRQIKRKIQLSRTPTKAKTFCTRCLVVTARCLSFLLTLVLWCGIISLIHLATLVQSEPLDDWLPFELPNHGPWRQWAEMTVFVLPALLIVLIRIAVMPLASILDKWE